MLNILFIDDEPIRAAKLAKHANVFVAHGPDQLSHYFSDAYRWDGICLDHDMPQMSGREVVELYVKERSIPTVVHSSNEPAAQSMVDTLREFAVTTKRLPITAKHWEHEVMSFFKAGTDPE